ncbi:MAG: FHA domain-containing protein [Myxococcota bacterium]
MIKQPGHADRVVRISEGATRMGRAEDNEIVLSDVGVSRRHAQVYVSRAEVSVEDLGSGNGTYYNGYRIQSQPVHDGDEIVIDPFVLHFKIRGQDNQGQSRPGERGSSNAARLQVVVGSGMAGSSYPIGSRGLSIGRSEDRDVVIADPAASRHHCQISAQGGEFVLRDMGSANGVFVNAVRVRECTLADGDLVRIGNTEMRFTRSEGGVDAPNHAPESRGGAVHRDTTRHESGATARSSTANERTSSAPPVRRGRSVGAWIGLFLGGSIVLAGLGAVVIFIVIVAVLILRDQGGRAAMIAADAQPPRWTLNLPVGLEPAAIDGLFADGQTKMRDRDHRGALQDFYRVLQTEPGYPYVDKFAFAAGEYLVLEELEEEFKARGSELVQRNAERDKLLREVKNGNRQAQLTAKTKLRRNFGDDPVVIKAIGGDTEGPGSKNQQKDAADAAKKMSEGQFDQASMAYSDLLGGTRDPVARNEALANLKLCQKEVARASAPKWTEAVIAEASGDRTTAKRLFQELKEEHPANPSPSVHLQRLP